MSKIYEPYPKGSGDDADHPEKHKFHFVSDFYNPRRGSLTGGTNCKNQALSSEKCLAARSICFSELAIS